MSPDGTHKLILIAEDDEDILELIRFRLTRDGHEIEVAHDGQQALTLATERTPDLIVLDVMMPKRSGYDVARELRGRPETKQTPILMLTARARDEDVSRGFEAGVDDYLTKPFSPDELRIRVESLLRRSGGQ